MKILYKIEIDGVNSWKVWSEGAKLFQEFYLNDKQILKTMRSLEGKVPAEKAFIKMSNLIERRKKEGYFETLYEAKLNYN